MTVLLLSLGNHFVIAYKALVLTFLDIFVLYLDKLFFCRLIASPIHPLACLPVRSLRRHRCYFIVKSLFFVLLFSPPIWTLWPLNLTTSDTSAAVTFTAWLSVFASASVSLSISFTLGWSPCPPYRFRDSHNCSCHIRNVPEIIVLNFCGLKYEDVNCHGGLLKFKKKN